VLRFLLLSVALLLAVSACAPRPGSPAAAPPAPLAPANDKVEAEVSRLRAALQQEAPGLIAAGPDGDRLWLVRAEAEARGRLTLQRPQLAVVIDRNPAVQQMRIVLARPQGPWESLGGSKVSTGQAGRRGYFLTPTGVYLHTAAILDYRAEGTFNAQHIRGLGLKGMRVWDFGWQTAAQGWGPAGATGEIRLLLHATDPDYLEPRLGRPASKGCVRIPAAMNRFLDRHGVLDADYEAAAQDDPVRRVLLPDREPTPLAGDALIVIDSAQAAEPSAPPLSSRSTARQSCS
jgi:hypothetical protein